METLDAFLSESETLARTAEREALTAALTATRGHRAQTASRLGISHAKLYRMLDRYPALAKRWPTKPGRKPETARIPARNARREKK